MVIFVISKSKHIGIQSFKATGGISLSEVHSKLFVATIIEAPKNPIHMRYKKQDKYIK